jgi:hypothetical protein
VCDDRQRVAHGDTALVGRELEKLRRFPEISREELVRYFTLTPADESFLIRHRRQGNRLGLAVQLCTLPWLGFAPDDVGSAPARAVERLADHLGVSAEALSSYGARHHTRTDHLVEATRFLRWRHGLRPLSRSSMASLPPNG